ncbi:MAG: DUF177 domain-containing protein, partial [Pseudomonadota bacterium]
MAQTNLVPLQELAKNRPFRFDVPLQSYADAMVHDLGVLGLAKMRFVGTLSPRNTSDWTLDATLGATVTLACVVTGDPVTYRIDEPVARTYTKAERDRDHDATELEMPDDDTVDPLPETLDLAIVFQEALSLALPDYPRKDDATLAQSVFTAEGLDPLTDERMNPFASLANL